MLKSQQRRFLKLVVRIWKMTIQDRHQIWCFPYKYSFNLEPLKSERFEVQSDNKQKRQY